METSSRSALFATYNRAMQLARQGELDAGRVNRALGIAQRRAKENPYNTTPDHCDCPDAIFRLSVCKHRIAAAMRAVAQ